MKINELIGNFTIYLSNEEQRVLDKVNGPCYISIFNENEQFVIESLIRKSLLTKSYYNGNMVVKPNEKS